ncbi:MAG TPA: YihY/virulence factor BrkB family protein [Sphaerochaeta sp.]|nr:YihY/virulence factor BrkB family protein [Sphaerochaeta sp.]
MNLKERLTHNVRQVRHFFASVVRQSLRDNILNSASGLVYSTLLAIVPALTFLFTLFNALGVLEPLILFLSQWFTELAGPEAGGQLMTLLTTYTRNATSLGVVGLISFLLTMVLLVNKVWSVINRIYRSSRSYNPVKRFAGFVTFLIISSLLLAAYVSVESSLTSWYFDILGIPIGRTMGALRTFGPSAIILIIFFLLIYFVPNTKVRFSAALLGSISGLAIITVFNMFSSFLTNMASNFSVIYGSFAAVFLFLFFCYVFWATVFFGVELAYVYQFKPEGGGFSGLSQSPALQISEGVNIMMLVGSNFRDGHGATTVREMVDRLAIPYNRLQGFLQLLTKLGYITPTNNSYTAYIPKKPLEGLFLQELTTAIYGLETLDEIERDTAGEAVAHEVQEKGVSSLGTVTIENLLQRI